MDSAIERLTADGQYNIRVIKKKVTKNSVELKLLIRVFSFAGFMLKEYIDDPESGEKLKSQLVIDTREDKTNLIRIDEFMSRATKSNYSTLLLQGCLYRGIPLEGEILEIKPEKGPQTVSTCIQLMWHRDEKEIAIVMREDDKGTVVAVMTPLSVMEYLLQYTDKELEARYAPARAIADSIGMASFYDDQQFESLMTHIDAEVRRSAAEFWSMVENFCNDYLIMPETNLKDMEHDFTCRVMEMIGRSTLRIEEKRVINALVNNMYTRILRKENIQSISASKDYLNFIKYIIVDLKNMIKQKN